MTDLLLDPSQRVVVVDDSWNYSRFPLTRTFKGNQKKVRIMGSLSYREFEENSREYGKKQFLLHIEHFNYI